MGLVRLRLTADSDFLFLCAPWYIPFPSWEGALLASRPGCSRLSTQTLRQGGPAVYAHFREQAVSRAGRRKPETEPAREHASFGSCGHFTASPAYPSWQQWTKSQVRS
jgi:hypothetical protein